MRSDPAVISKTNEIPPDFDLEQLMDLQSDQVVGAALEAALTTILEIEDNHRQIGDSDEAVAEYVSTLPLVVSTWYMYRITGKTPTLEEEGFLDHVLKQRYLGLWGFDFHLNFSYKILILINVITNSAIRFY